MTAAHAPDIQELLRLSIGPACHELRSPLAVVYGFARMLEQHDDLDEAAHAKYVGQIVRSAERLDVMLDSLSRIGRIASLRTHPQLETVTLGDLVVDAASSEENVERVTLDRGPHVTVRADPTWLREALFATIDGLCFEQGIDVNVSWRREDHDAEIHVVPSSSFPMIDVEPEKSSLGISLARVQIVAMGGTYSGSGDRVVLRLPRT